MICLGNLNLRILFVNTHNYKPQSVGGMAILLDNICLGCIQTGNHASVLAGFSSKTDGFGRRTRIRMKFNKVLGGQSVARDHFLSYPTWRAWDPIGAIPYVVSKETPDLIVIMGGAVVPAARAARMTGVPVSVQVHDVEFDWHKGDFSELSDLQIVANSNFTAEKYHKCFGVTSEVVYPYMPLERFRVNTRRTHVTFVNPIIRKGLRLALEIAALCPEIAFEFVGKLPDVDEQGQKVCWGGNIGRNITLTPFRTDMKEVYEKSRVLLVPSKWEETYGQVVNEAQISGIPVLASDRGGIPEAVGKGGIVLSPHLPATEWAKALRKIWSDEHHYEELSRRAVESATREELQYNYQMEKRLGLYRAAIRDFTTT